MIIQLYSFFLSQVLSLLLQEPLTPWSEYISMIGDGCLRRGDEEQAGLVREEHFNCVQELHDCLFHGKCYRKRASSKCRISTWVWGHFHLLFTLTYQQSRLHVNGRVGAFQGSGNGLWQWTTPPLIAAHQWMPQARSGTCLEVGDFNEWTLQRAQVRENRAQRTISMLNGLLIAVRHRIRLWLHYITFLTCAIYISHIHLLSIFGSS